MIPTLILLGAAFGRWWKVTLVVGTLGWPIYLALPGGGEVTLLAVVLAFANTLAGVLLHQLVALGIRRFQGKSHSQVHGGATSST